MKPSTHRKRAHERVAKTSISLPPALYAFASERVAHAGYTSLSGFLQDLVRREFSRVKSPAQ